MTARDPDRANRPRGDGRAHAALRALAVDLLELGVARYLTVPGAPATGLVSELVRAGARVDDALNEKVAAEVAFGLSLAGETAAVVMKGNGALLAAEPLQNAGPHGTRAPLLLLVGDDVDSSSSTVPTDARPLGPLLVLPVFDLGPGELRRATVQAALDAAVSTRRPVILRFTASMECDVDERPAHPGETVTELRAPDAAPDDPFRLSKLSRFLDFAETRAEDLEVAADAAPHRTRSGPGRQGIIATGATWDLLLADLPEEHDEPALGISAVYPVPARVLDFCGRLDRVLVLEEGRPFLEDAVQLLLSRAGLDTRVIGQRSGHLPPLGPTRTSEVVAALEGTATDAVTQRLRPPEPGVEEHQYRTVFEALEKVHADTGIDIHTCVGSCISVAYAPYSIATSALNLGGATGVAAGFSSATGRPSIALIGDYGLIHSGLTAHQLIEADGIEVLTIVLANGTSTKTGGQPSAVAPDTPGRRPLDLDQLVSHTTGPGRVTTLDLARSDVETMTSTIAGMLRDLPATLLIVSGEVLDGG